MKTFENILINEKIPYRTITSKGQKPMIQILKAFKTQWLKTIIKNQGLKITTIDNTCLIFES